MTSRPPAGETSELLLARHGQAYCNITGTIAGPGSCTGLTTLGRNQSQALAARLHHEPAVTAIYASPRRRARETAGIIGRALTLPVSVHDDLREPDYGPAAEGRTWTDLLAAFPGDPATRHHMPLAEGGEPWTASASRVMRALTALAAAHPGRRILIVGHDETVKSAYHLFLGIPASQPLPIRLTVANASLTTWHKAASAPLGTIPARWTLVVHNDTSHLAEALAGTR